MFESRKHPRTDEDLLPERSNSKRQKCNESPVFQPQPPESWDNLSTVWLTRSALKELDRRNGEASQPSQQLPSSHIRRPVTRNFLAQVRVLAKRGGPDLSDLKGYPEPCQSRMLSLSESSIGRQNARREPTSVTKSATNLSKTTTNTKNSSPYDRNFQQILIDGRVLAHRYRFRNGRAPPKPSNWDDLAERARQSRESLSPSRFSDSAFDQFEQADSLAKKEEQVTKYVLPHIEGEVKNGTFPPGKLQFGNLCPLTQYNLTPGNPDLYYGSPPEELDRRVRDDLSKFIIPSTQDDLPIAPNFFLAAKGPGGALEVAERQASCDGSLGERGQVYLESWKQGQLIVENKAHTITSIYTGGTLSLYSIHAAQPRGPEGRIEYYMHRIDAYAMAGNPRTFREGLAAFRNLRDWAEEQRSGAIERANERARMMGNGGADEEMTAEFSDASNPAHNSGPVAGARVDEQAIDDTILMPPPARQAAPERRTAPKIRASTKRAPAKRTTCTAPQVRRSRRRKSKDLD